MEGITKTLDILFSLGLNYPIIKYLGCSMNKPIACVLSSFDEAEKIIQCLSPFSNPKIVSASTTPKSCKKMLAKANSEFVFIYYTNIPQFKKVMQIAITATQTGRIDETNCNAIPLIFFQLTIPEEWKECCFHLYLTGTIPSETANDNRAEDIINAFFSQYQITQNLLKNWKKKIL